MIPFTGWIDPQMPAKLVMSSQGCLTQEVFIMPIDSDIRPGSVWIHKKSPKVVVEVLSPTIRGVILIAPVAKGSHPKPYSTSANTFEDNYRPDRRERTSDRRRS